MKRPEKLALIAAKAAAILAVIPDETKRTFFRSFIGPACDLHKLPSSAIAEALWRYEELFEGMIAAFPKDVEAQIREPLVARFGTSKLRVPQVESVDDIRHQGRIKTEEGYRELHDFLADTTNIETVGMDEYKRLGAILDSHSAPRPRKRGKP
jgi:hypothetical protein